MQRKGWIVHPLVSPASPQSAGKQGIMFTIVSQHATVNVTVSPTSIGLNENERTTA